MASLWPYVLGGVAVGLLPILAAGKKSVPGGKPAPAGTRQKRFRCAFTATGLGDDWLRFFEQTARRESNFRPRAHNDSDGEVAASKRLNDRVGVVSGIDFNTYAWDYGSKGLFQFLGAVVAVRGGTLRFPANMTKPDMGFDPGISMAAALDYANGLMGWKNFAGTWASLNIGWGNPSKMGNASSLVESARKMEDRAAKLGWARGWANREVPTFRRRSQSEMRALALTAKAYYDAC